MTSLPHPPLPFVTHRLFGVLTIPDIAREGADFVNRLKSDNVWVRSRGGWEWEGPPAAVTITLAAIVQHQHDSNHFTAIPNQVIVVEKMRLALGDQIMESVERAVLLTTSNDITRAAVDHGHVGSAGLVV